MQSDLNIQLNQLREQSERLSHSENTTNTDKFLSFYTRIMTKVTNAERCSVFIHDPQNDKVWLKSGTGVHEHEIEVPTENSVVGQVIATGEPMVVSDLDQKSDASKLVQEQTGFETRNILCVPIMSPDRDVVTGAFQLLNKINAPTFNDEDMAAVIELAEHMQDQVHSVFLSQEIFGLSEKINLAINKTTSIMAGIIVILLAIVSLLLTAYILIPWMMN